MLVILGVWICEAISTNVGICFHTVQMNHHADWVESPSPCYKLDTARYLVIMCSAVCVCVCVSSLSPAWAAWAHTKRQLCHRERSIAAEGLFSVFPSKENSTFTCHFSFPKCAGEAEPPRSARPDGQQWLHSASELSGCWNAERKRAGVPGCVSTFMITHDRRKTFYLRELWD